MFMLTIKFLILSPLLGSKSVSSPVTAIFKYSPVKVHGYKLFYQ